MHWTRSSKRIVRGHGDSNVAGGAAAMQTNATAAIVNVSRVIASVHIILSLWCGEQKRHNPIE